jgi:hypothetical protein
MKAIAALTLCAGLASLLALADDAAAQTNPDTSTAPSQGVPGVQWMRPPALRPPQRPEDRRQSGETGSPSDAENAPAAPGCPLQQRELQLIV